MSDILLSFPIQSQTSLADKEFLLNAMGLLSALSDGYEYLEIGSFLGGTLAPFLADPNCRKAFSVDDREREQPDERGLNYSYRGITTQ